MNSGTIQHQYFPNQLILIVILKISCFAVFIGRAWEHIRWDPPYRAFLWNQELLEGMVEWLTGLSWVEYASSIVVDNAIQTMTYSIGWFYVLCAVASLVVSKKHVLIYRICKPILIAGSLGLMFLALLYCKERFFELGQFLEYASQFGSPLFLLFAVSAFSKKSLAIFLKVAIALTFICHGLYALNFYPTPGEWVDMVILSLKVSEQNAFKILHLAGVLDVIFSVLIFSPGLVRPAAIYLFLWGLITTSARIYANLYIDSIYLILEQYSHQVLYRIPHFLLPILLFLIAKKESSFLINRIKNLIITDKNKSDIITFNASEPTTIKIE